MTRPLLGLAGLLVVWAGCSPIHGHSRAHIGGKRVSADLRDVPVKGHEVEVNTRFGRSYTGELLAVDGTSVWLRTVSGSSPPIEIPIDRIREVEVSLYSSGAAGIVVWEVLGALSSGTHGIFFPISLAIWLGGGIPSTIAPFKNDDIDMYKGQIHKYLWQYARFPQGLPAVMAPDGNARPRTQPSGLKPEHRPPAKKRTFRSPAWTPTDPLDRLRRNKRSQDSRPIRVPKPKKRPIETPSSSRTPDWTGSPQPRRPAETKGKAPPPKPSADPLERLRRPGP